LCCCCFGVQRESALDCVDAEAAPGTGGEDGRLLLEFLVEEHVAAAEAPAPLSGLDALLHDYHAWLIGDRGLAEATVLRYQTCARRFLELRTGRDGAVNVESLTALEVTAFLLSEALSPDAQARLNVATTVTAEQQAALERGDLVLPHDQLAYLTALSRGMDGKTTEQIRDLTRAPGGGRLVDGMRLATNHTS
jgi:hypothetical protein